jgi:hypothetical protein
LIVALDRIGKAVYPAWTGDEILAAKVEERSDSDLKTDAFKILMREGETRHESDILAELRDQYERATAPRRRRDAVMDRLLRFLHQDMLPVISYGSNGKIYQVSNHVWGADGIEEVFDTDGLLLVQGEAVEFRRGLTRSDNTAMVLVNATDLQSLLKQPGFPDNLIPPPEAQHRPASGEPPGPKGGEPKVAKLACEIAETLLRRGVPARGRGRLAELSRLVEQKLAEQGHKRKADSIRRSYVGPYLKEWEKKNPGK